MEKILSATKEVNDLLERISSNMQFLFGYAPDEARALIVEYCKLFTDKTYCDSIGLRVQDDDYFFHEAAMGMAMRIHYYLGIKADPDPDTFLSWRKDFVLKMKESQRGNTN